MTKIDSARFNTIKKFTYCLLDHQIPFVISCHLGGAKWTFPFCDGDFICNIAIHNPSMVESMAMPWDGEDVTQLYVPEAIKLLLHFYKSTIDNQPRL